MLCLSSSSLSSSVRPCVGGAMAKRKTSCLLLLVVSIVFSWKARRFFCWGASCVQPTTVPPPPPPGPTTKLSPGVVRHKKNKAAAAGCWVLLVLLLSQTGPPHKRPRLCTGKKGGRLCVKGACCWHAAAHPSHQSIQSRFDSRCCCCSPTLRPTLAASRRGSKANGASAPGASKSTASLEPSRV